MRVTLRQLWALITAVCVVLAVVPPVVASPALSDGVLVGLQLATGQGLQLSQATTLDSPAFVFGCALGLVYSCAVVATGYFSVRMLWRRS